MFAAPGGSGPAGHPGARRINRSVDSRAAPGQGETALVAAGG